MNTLPPKPSTSFVSPQLPQKPQTTTAATESPFPASSSSSQLICKICSKPSKYTCPGCSTRTCSLPCSTAHKKQTGCSGERNKAAYVPMNQYGWGTMMNDYTFLEGMARQVSDWGNEIVRGGYMAGGGDRGRGGTSRGRGRGGQHSGGPPRTKRDILKMQLEARDIDVDLLPVGMERRKANQSIWDFKNQTAMLTIEFKFHKPRDPLAPSSTPLEPPFVVLTHRNDLKTPLITLLRTSIEQRSNSKKDASNLEWARRLVFPEVDDAESFSNPTCVMAAQINPRDPQWRNAIKKKAYYGLDASQTLGTVLRHTHFVEYPTIEVWAEFQGTIVDAQQGTVTVEEEAQPKRRKLNAKAGKQKMKGLLGDYGSDEEHEEEGEKKNALSTLDNYAESDEDNDEQALELQGSDEEGIDAEVDPAVLLELMKHVQSRASWDEEVVDWDDDDGPEE
ncbi:hypothetical protein CVT24_002014 [Panaeolus cyanescens]|uniref:HIT-type domain-containing protein n=1 Tax=Panaeolus cyanescens TaxID=181874 RepID=A0A409YHM2_9AGAR|nr:hypothetical protein CVT24_002014 [Panaeolus cyanescens]